MNKTKEEIEVVFLEIDKEQIEKKLLSIGASKVRDFFLSTLIFRLS